jgi:hypothetical protein
MIGSTPKLFMADALMPAVIAVMAPVRVWPMAVAVPASAIQIFA